MGREANTKKDRECRICGDIRLRTAKEMVAHYNHCLERESIEQRLHNAGLYPVGGGIITP